MTLGGLIHQPVQAFLELDNCLTAFTTLYVSTFTQQAGELGTDVDDGPVVIAAKEVTVERDVAGQAVGGDFHFRQPHVALFVFTQAGVVSQARLLAGVQTLLQLGQPGLHHRVVTQLLQGHLRQVHEVLG
ncbi:hypothetical protein D3C80_1449960 [compost metagenome]